MHARELSEALDTLEEVLKLKEVSVISPDYKESTVSPYEAIKNVKDAFDKTEKNHELSKELRERTLKDLKKADEQKQKMINELKDDLRISLGPRSDGVVNTFISRCEHLSFLFSSNSQTDSSTSDIIESNFNPKKGM